MLISQVACSNEPLYSRDDCIARVNIDWSRTFPDDKERMINQIMDAIRKAPDMGFNKTPPSSAVQGDARQFIYYQYEKDCANRLENTEKLLHYVRESLDNHPPLKADSGSYSPGTDTIRVSGPWWKD